MFCQKSNTEYALQNKFSQYSSVLERNEEHVKTSEVSLTVVNI